MNKHLTIALIREVFPGPQDGPGLAECLGRARDAGSPELVAEDLRLAVRALGRITGRVDVEDLLDVIFREFCIGK